MITTVQENAVWPPSDQPLKGKDLIEFRRRFYLDINQMEAVFGITSRKAWYASVKEKADEPLDLSAAILMRFYVAFSDLIPFTGAESAEELRNRLNVSPAAFGLLSGRQEISVRQWDEDRDPLPVVRNLQRIAGTAMTMMEGKKAINYEGEEIMAGLLKAAVAEWQARNVTPESRRQSPVNYENPFVIELLGLLPPDRLVEAIGHEPGQALRWTIKQEREKRVQGKADRHKATSDDRSSLVAKRALGDMVSTVKF
ncbi:TPA: hypothetical protein ACKROR_001630 [Pseudomonas aeruginosa]